MSACRRLMSDAIVAHAAGTLVLQCSSPGASTCFEHHLGSCALLRVPGAGTTCFHRPVCARHISFDCCQLCLALLAPPPRVDVPRVPGLTHLVRQGLYSTPNMNSMPYLCAGALDIFWGICTCIGSQRRCFLSKPCPAVCWHPSCPGQHILLTRAICRRSGHPVARATTMPQNPSDTWPLAPCP